MNLKKCLFILPNLFTLSSVFCGFYAIAVTAAAETPRQFMLAGLALLLAILFDASDGRVARLTRTQSKFGVELDSLADVISFGVAPAFLIYRWALMDLGLGGLFICFVYVAAGVCRLARFNVMALGERTPSSDFVGLPIPLAAGILAGLVIAHARSGAHSVEAIFSVSAVVLGLSALMVSNVRYRSFKKARPSAVGIGVIALFLVVVVGLGVVFPFSSVLVMVFLLYVLYGLLEEVVRLGRSKMVVLRTTKFRPGDSVEMAEEDLDQDPLSEDMNLE